MGADSSSDYLDGIVAAVARIGTFIFSMGLISGLILVIFYSQHFSVNDDLYGVAYALRDSLAKEESRYAYQVESIEVHLSTATPTDTQLLEDVRPYCSGQFDLAACRDKLVGQLVLKGVTGEQLLQKIIEHLPAEEKLVDQPLLQKISHECRESKSLSGCRSALVDQRSQVRFRIARIDNEMKLVTLGRVKLPFLGYEIPTNDASVILGFFLVIIGSVTVITVQHLQRVFADKDIAEKVSENVTLLRARLILIYAPLDGVFLPYLTVAIFFMPAIVMMVMTGAQGWQLFSALSDLNAQHVFRDAVVQMVILSAMTLFLTYVAASLMSGWRQIGKVVGQLPISPPTVPPKSFPE